MKKLTLIVAIFAGLQAQLGLSCAEGCRKMVTKFTEILKSENPANIIELFGEEAQLTWASNGNTVTGISQIQDRLNQSFEKCGPFQIETDVITADIHHAAMEFSISCEKGHKFSGMYAFTIEYGKIQRLKIFLGK